MHFPRLPDWLIYAAVVVALLFAAISRRENADAPEAPATAAAPRGKLFIETHGCQMNEYDSAKMADVLAAAEGLEPALRLEDRADSFNRPGVRWTRLAFSKTA